MTQNHIIWVNRPISVRHREHGLAPCGTPEAQRAYAGMWEICRDSVRQWLEGEWQEHVLTEPLPDRQSMFRDTYDYTRALWHQGNVNILFMDSDTIVLQRTQIWDQFQEFRLFNVSTPRTHRDYPVYLNSAVRYFPATMAPEVWQVGDRLRAQWPEGDYDYEQRMYNAMFWSQGDLPLRPELNFQMPAARSARDIVQWQDYNRCSARSAQIVHYHGTRGPESAWRIARELEILSRPELQAQAHDYVRMEQEERPFARRLVTWMAYNTPGRVVDLGAGTGVYVDELRQQGIAAQGYDTTTLQTRPDLVVTQSLLEVTDPAPVVMCLEVAEHIDAEHERAVIDSVWRNTLPGGYVIWSAAQPGQGGVGHINLRPPDYWRAIAESRGFRSRPDLEADLHGWITSGYHMGWFAQNRQVWQRPA